MGGDPGRAGPDRAARRHNGRAAGRPPGHAHRRRGRPGGGRRRRGRDGPGGVPGPAQPGDRPGPRGRAGGELPLPRAGLGHGPRPGAAGVLPQGLALHNRADRRHHPPRGHRVPGLRNRARPGHRSGPAGRHDGDRGKPRPLRRRAGGRQRRQRPAGPADQDPVLPGQVIPDVHPRRPVADPGGRG